jgi:hypothetical protein
MLGAGPPGDGFEAQASSTQAGLEAQGTAADSNAPRSFAIGSGPQAESARLVADDVKAPVYKPRAPRAPRVRIEGGTRGPEQNAPTVIPLVPDHVGLTIAPQPLLYWYLSKPTTSQVMFVLVDARSVQVISGVTLAPPTQPGVQLVRLKDFGVSLEQDVQYRWYITVVLDPDKPSRDIVAGGMIQRVSPEFATTRPPSANNLEAVRFYAEAGLWYDALASISDLIAAAPSDHLLRKQRAGLLRQVGLSEVAEWDLRQTGNP